jgi:putative acyl-CoA dehydrogenase
MARLYREAPLNGIWEGAGNVVCLDVLRSIQKFPATVPALLDELRSAKFADPRYDAFLADLEKDIADILRSEGSARRFVERIALALSASLQIRYGPTMSPMRLSHPVCRALVRSFRDAAARRED